MPSTIRKNQSSHFWAVLLNEPMLFRTLLRNIPISFPRPSFDGLGGSGGPTSTNIKHLKLVLYASTDHNSFIHYVVYILAIK